MMEFVSIKIKELEQFANSSFNLTGKHVAITPWRAASHVRNPYARPDDVVLIYAKDEKGLICGYIGAIPAELDGNPGIRYIWNSCWWVKKSKSGLASGLLNELLKIWEYRLLLSDMTERTAGIINRYCPSEIKSRIGFHIWLRSDVSNKLIRSRKKNLLNKYLKIFALSRILSIPDSIVNFFIFPIQILKVSKFRNTGFVYSESEVLDKQDEIFMMKNTGNDISFPEKKWLNWVKNNPWLIPKTSGNQDFASKYYFNSFARENKLFFLKIKKDRELKGLFLLSLRDGTLKTQFVYIDKTFKNQIIECFINYIMRGYKFKDLITFNPMITEYLQEIKMPLVRKRKITRFYLVSNPVSLFTGKDFTMQDGSGDYIFT